MPIVVTVKLGRHVTTRRASVCVRQATMAHNAKEVSIFEYDRAVKQRDD